MTEASSCALCRETRPERFRIWFDGWLKLYRCRTCGFVAQYAGPGLDTPRTDYEDAYTLDFLSQGKEFMYPHRRRAFAAIARRIRAVCPGGDLLDVGCGDGQFLQVCAEHGFSGRGVEHCGALARYAAEKTGAAVVHGRYSRDLFPAESFDVVALIQVLEHLAEPLDTLRSALFHLRPGGVLAVEVPSIRAPQFLAWRLTRVKRFVAPPAGIIPSHIGYYAPDTLERMVEAAGFELIFLTTGRWRERYAGLAGLTGRVLDPLFDLLRIGGIFYLGRKA
ncbi:MAG: class I SAM-dependent methyltransferase [Thermodesulfobacteriota bacterium]